MSYQEKRIITTIITGMLILAAYCIYSFGKVQSGATAPEDLKFWAGNILIFIGIGIVATIIIQIVFHILLSIAIAVKEKVRDENQSDQEIDKTIKAETVEDEMDKLIELKSNRVGSFLAGAGFIAALVAVLFSSSAVMMLNIIFVSFSAGTILEGFAQLYYYRKGI
jgi:hypothetical protein